MMKIFLSCMLPLLALACMWFALVFLVGGLRMLRLRIRTLVSGLHAGSALRRSLVDYVPVFTYTDSRGDEVDIMGDECYPSEQAALQAKRPLVYAAERPDAPMARNAWCYIARPVMMLLAAVLLCAVSHYLLLIMAD